MQYDIQRKQVVWFTACISISCMQMLKVKSNLQQLGVLMLGYCSHRVPVTLGLLLEEEDKMRLYYKTCIINVSVEVY
jgi:hypothetical protein